MKRLLILLLVLMLIMAGCSAGNAKEEPLSQETVSEPPSSIEESLNEGQPSQGQDLQDSQGLQDHQKDSQDPSQRERQAPNKNEELSEPSTNVGKGENGESSPEFVGKNLLKIQGAVEEELFLTVDDLKSMDDIIFEADFYSLNSFGTTGYTHFKGVKLWDLLKERALIKTDASKVSIMAQDGYKMEFTLEQVQKEYIDETNPDNKYPMIIAWEENGAEYTTEKGAPYKLAVGQTEPGDVNKPQWVSNIDVIIIE